MAIQVLTKLIELLQSIRNCITKKKTKVTKENDIIRRRFY